MSPFSTPRSHPSEVNSLHRAALRLKKTDSNDIKTPHGTPPGTPTESVPHRSVRLKKTDSDDSKPPRGTQTPPLERQGTPTERHQETPTERHQETPTERQGTSKESSGFQRTIRLKKSNSDETKLQQSAPPLPHQPVQSPTAPLPPTQPRPKKTKVSVLAAASAELRPSSGPGRLAGVSRQGSSTIAQPAVKIKSTSSTKTYVTRRRGSENSSLTQQLLPS